MFWFTKTYKHASETKRRNLHKYEMSPFKGKTKGCQAYEIFRAQQMIYEEQVRR